MQLFGEKEIDLIEDFKMTYPEEILIMSEDKNNEIEKIIELVKNIDKWIDSSGKDKVPPDFYNEENKIMMEVMRVDDHGYRKHGKSVNPTYAKENKIRKELEEKGFDQLFPNAKLIATVDTGLPTEGDHNYIYYYKNFERTIKHHCERIVNYRNNHKGYKLIFFIYDESTAYTEAESSNNIVAFGKMHFHFLDKRFVKCFINDDIDYIIWMTPYKRYAYVKDDMQPPMVTIYSKNKLVHELFEYDEKKMISAEK